MCTLDDDAQGDLKAILFSLTGVPPERMKLVGLIKGKLPGDDQEIVKLGLQPRTSSVIADASATAPVNKAAKRKEFMMIGTPEGQEHKAPVGPTSAPGDEPDVEYATAGAATREALKAIESVRNRRKLNDATQALVLDQMREPRRGKKLLGESTRHRRLRTGATRRRGSWLSRVAINKNSARSRRMHSRHFSVERTQFFDPVRAGACVHCAPEEC